MNRLHGRRQDKVDYFMRKNYDKMSTLERDNALLTLEKQADQLDQLGEIKQKIDEAIEEKKVEPPPKKVQQKLIVKNVEMIEASEMDRSGF